MQYRSTEDGTKATFSAEYIAAVGDVDTSILVYAADDVDASVTMKTTVPEVVIQVCKYIHTCIHIYIHTYIYT